MVICLHITKRSYIKENRWRPCAFFWKGLVKIFGEVTYMYRLEAIHTLTAPFQPKQHSSFSFSFVHCDQLNWIRCWNIYLFKREKKKITWKNSVKKEQRERERKRKLLWCVCVCVWVHLPSRQMGRSLPYFSFFLLVYVVRSAVCRRSSNPKGWTPPSFNQHPKILWFFFCFLSLLSLHWYYCGQEWPVRLTCVD